jgi:hypothetical protein
MNLNNHPLGGMIAALMTPAAAAPRVKPGTVAVSVASTVAVLDGVDDDAPSGAAAYAQADMRLKAVAALHQWAETTADDLADGESSADRLLALVVGIADSDKDGEISDDEAELCNVVLEAMWDYLTAKGVSEEDCSALLNDFDAAAADRIMDLLVSALPNGDEATAADMDSFAFDADSDAAVFDAVYRKKIAVRKGKKVRINKRVSGHVRLSAKQKISIRKMLRKSHNAVATMHRAKSNRVRKSAGL